MYLKTLSILFRNRKNIQLDSYSINSTSNKLCKLSLNYLQYRYKHSISNNYDTLFYLLLEKSYSVPIVHIIELHGDLAKKMLKNYWTLVLKRGHSHLRYNSTLLITRLLCTDDYNPEKSEHLTTNINMKLNKSSSNEENKNNISNTNDSTETSLLENEDLCIHFLMAVLYKREQNGWRSYKWYKRLLLKKRNKRIYKQKYVFYKLLALFHESLSKHSYDSYVQKISNYNWITNSLLQSNLRNVAFKEKDFSNSIRHVIYGTEIHKKYNESIEIIKNELTIDDLKKVNSFLKSLKKYSNYYHLSFTETSPERQRYTSYLRGISKQPMLYPSASEFLGWLNKLSVSNSFRQSYSIYSQYILAKKVQFDVLRIEFNITKDIIHLLFIEKENIISVINNTRNLFCKCFDEIRLKWLKTGGPIFNHLAGRTLSKIPDMPLYDTELEHTSKYWEGYGKHVVKRIKQMIQEKKSMKHNKNRYKNDTIPFKIIIDTKTETIVERDPKNDQPLGPLGEVEPFSESNHSIVDQIQTEQKSSYKVEVTDEEENNPADYYKKRNIEFVGNDTDAIFSEFNGLIASDVDLFIDDYRWSLYFMFKDYHVAKFINFLMIKGKKNSAYKILFDVLKSIKKVFVLSPLLLIKGLFSSNHQYFVKKIRHMKKKQKVNLILYNWKKRTNTFYHVFFKELKNLYITDYLSISDKLSYLLLDYYDMPLYDSLDQSIESEGEQFYENRFMLKKKKWNKKNKTVYKYKDYMRDPDELLNYKKKY